MEKTKDVFAVDKYALDREYVTQVDLRKEYCRKAAESNEEHRRSEGRLKVIEAEVKAEIRKDPASFGVDKATEDSIKSAMILDSRYQDALDEEITAEKEKNMHIGFLKVLDDRKSAIENLLKMVLGEFYAHPKMNNNQIQETVRRDEAYNAFSKKKSKK